MMRNKLGFGLQRTRRCRRSGLGLAAILTAGLLLPPPNALAETVTKPIQTVMPVVSVSLFTSGVGFFRHAIDLDGPVQVSLPFKAEEINDVLKSLVIDTPSGEPGGFAVFPSQQPVDRLLKGFSVDLSGNPTMAEILTQLRGTPIRFTYQGKGLEGRVLGVEQRPLSATRDPDKVVMDWFVNVATAEGLRAMPLRDIEEVQLSRDETIGDLVKALDALEQAGGHERKSLQLSFPGTGKRRISVGYIVETSIWKSGYRLMLPQENSPPQKAPLHGWAIVENQTDNDWNGVRLALVSGRPISFVQELYAPRYANRPRIAPKGHEEIIPVQHEAGVSPPRHAERQKLTGNKERSLLAAAAPPAKGMDVESMEELAEADQARAPENNVSEPMVASVDEDDSVSVRFSVEGVNLPRRRGAMIPFFTRSVPMERVSLFNIKSHTSHPLRGVMIENDSGLHLPAGPVTLFDGNRYAGDALLDDLPPGRKGLLTHAMDQDIKVLVTPKRTSGRLTSGRISKGILKLSRRNLSQYSYLLKNSSAENRVVLIEHARTPGWNLVKPESPFEITSAVYRFRLDVAPAEEKQLQITEETVLDQKIQLTRNLSSVIFSYASEEGFSDQLKKSLEEASRLQGRVEELDRKINDFTRDLRNDSEEQTRVRANLSSVSANTAFYNRMMSKMDTLESAIEQKNTEVVRLKTERDAARKRLEAFVEALEI